MVPPLRRVTFEERESNQSASAPPFGASLRLGMPSLRHCSGGPPPSAIHGRGRLPRHPCRGSRLRNTCVRPLGKGQADQKPKPKPKPKPDAVPVGASLLAKNVRTPRSFRQHALSFTSFASRLAPTGGMSTHEGVRRLERPSGGSAQWATRHGCRVSRSRPWMADGGGPTEQDRSEGMPSISEAPNERGKSALVTFALFESDSP